MSGWFTVVGCMIGAACGMVIGNGLVNLINERLIRRIIREEIDAEDTWRAGWETEKSLSEQREMRARWRTEAILRGKREDF